MKRIIKSSLLTFMLLATSFIFAQSSFAHGGYGHGGYSHGKYFKTASCSYDRCSGRFVKTVVVYKNYYRCFKGYCCVNGCPKYYTYGKRYCYPVKSTSYYYCAKPCNPCNPCNSCCN